MLCVAQCPELCRHAAGTNFHLLNFSSVPKTKFVPKKAVSTDGVNGDRPVYVGTILPWLWCVFFFWRMSMSSLKSTIWNNILQHKFEMKKFGSEICDEWDEEVATPSLCVCICARVYLCMYVEAIEEIWSLRNTLFPAPSCCKFYRVSSHTWRSMIFRLTCTHFWDSTINSLLCLHV